MAKHHTIISGTGRTGTTFLMQLFTVLGLDTGYQDTASDIYPNCNAGMEWDIRSPEAPYLIKNPSLCDYLECLLDGGEIAIDRAIVPIRDLFSAAESRRDVERRHNSNFLPGSVPGGLWHTQEPEDQESILQRQFYRILHTLTEHDIPTTRLHFPRFIHDPQYLFYKVRPVIPDVELKVFLNGFHEVVRPELIHAFRAAPAFSTAAA